MLGTAGSGKTVLTRTLYDWFSEKKLDVATLNLDAGVRRLPYNPDIDVRRHMMKLHGIGYLPDHETAAVKTRSISLAFKRTDMETMRSPAIGT